MHFLLPSLSLLRVVRHSYGKVGIQGLHSPASAYDHFGPRLETLMFNDGMLAEEEEEAVAEDVRAQDGEHMPGVAVGLILPHREHEFSAPAGQQASLRDVAH